MSLGALMLLLRRVPAQVWLVGLLVAFVLIIGWRVYDKGRDDAVAEIKIENAEQRIEDIRAARDIDHTVRGLPMTDIEKELQRWSVPSP